jgi:glutamine---fructose-6-phosphate transaminase (isomerizing)
MRLAPGQQMLAEIYEQPAALARLLAREGPRVRTLLAGLLPGRPRFIFIAARGTSDHAALYGKYALETLTGIPVGLAAPSVTSVYGAQVDYREGLVIGISQSGEAADVAAVLAGARAAGAATLAISNVPDSPLTRAAAGVMLLHAGDERSVAATKTYTCTMAALLLLAGALAAEPAVAELVTRLPSLVTETLADSAVVAEGVAQLTTLKECIVLGRGYNLATAYELALKLRQTCYVRAQPYASPDFVHGPIASLDTGYPVLAIANRGPALASVLDVITRARAAGARVIALGNAEEAWAAADVAFPVRSVAEVPEVLSPFPCAVIGQLLAYELARLRGLDPDHPRGLKKVTVTW